MKINPNFSFNLPPLSRYAVYVAIVAAIILEITAIINFLPDFYQKMTSDRQKLSALVTENKELSNAETSLVSLNPTDVDNSLRKATLALPDIKKVSGLVTGFTTLASSSGITVVALDFTPGRVSSQSGNPALVTAAEIALDKGVRAIQASLVVASNLDTLGYFLNSLNTKSQLTGVNGLEFNRIPGGRTGAQFSVLIYFQPVNREPVDFRKVQLLTASEESIAKNLSDQDYFALPGAAQ